MKSKWELIETKKQSVGGIYSRKHIIFHEWGYLTKKGGMRLIHEIGSDGLETVKVLACVNMTQKQVDLAMKKFRQQFPEQDENLRQKLLAARTKRERERNNLLNEIKRKNEENRKREEAQQRKIQQQKEKYQHIK